MIDHLNHHIKQSLLSLLPKHSHLYEPAHYALFPGGKRIRPLLTLLTYKALSNNTLLPYQPSIALEFIHTYSLIHDDLPAMDNDDRRRGKHSLHCAYNEATALLVGDFFLTAAFELICLEKRSEKTQLKLLHVLAQKSGGKYLLDGQILDLHQSKPSNDVNAKKTGSLFSAAFLFGGICAGVNEDCQKKLDFLGLNFGLLFQHMDDLIDHDTQEIDTFEKKYDQCLSLTKDLFLDSSELIAIFKRMRENAYLALEH